MRSYNVVIIDVMDFFIKFYHFTPQQTHVKINLTNSSHHLLWLYQLVLLIAIRAKVLGQRTRNPKNVLGSRHLFTSHFERCHIHLLLFIVLLEKYTVGSIQNGQENTWYTVFFVVLLATDIVCCVNTWQGYIRRLNMDKWCQLFGIECWHWRERKN